MIQLISRIISRNSCLNWILLLKVQRLNLDMITASIKTKLSYKKVQTDVFLLPQIEINGQLYRASNIRKNGFLKSADVVYWTDGFGWREVHSLERIERVAILL